MTITIDIAPDVEPGLRESAQRQGQTPEEAVAMAVRSAFAPQSLAESCFVAAAEATRHVWDTPDEDAAWAHLFLE